MTVDTMSREDRVMLARAALARAEQRTGARSVLPLGGLAATVRTAPEVAAAVVALVPDLPDEAPEPPTTGIITSERPPMAVPPPLVPIMPEGLRRGGTTVVTGSTSLVLAILAHACAGVDPRPAARLDRQHHARAGPVGGRQQHGTAVPCPRGQLAALGVGQGDLGADDHHVHPVEQRGHHGRRLETRPRHHGQPVQRHARLGRREQADGRLAVVPRPGIEAPTVVAALLDGVDVVVVGPDVALSDAERRKLSARARDRGSVLLSTADWPGAGVVLTVESGRWTGIDAGEGRLRTHEIRLVRTGRGSAAVPRALDLTLPLGSTPQPQVAAPAPGLRLVG